MQKLIENTMTTATSTLEALEKQGDQLRRVQGDVDEVGEMLERFNVVAPALVQTPGAQRAAADPHIASYVRHKQPLDEGRIGQPEDVDGAVVYLLSAESRFVTGQVLAVDGGWCVSEPPTTEHERQ